MVLPWKKSSDQDHEAIFIERYGRVRSWLLQLTEHDQELTEDLLHDAFIHFTFTRPDLSAIRNLDGYLYGLVRNLHISHLRRAAHNRFKQLSIIDYDSGELGLRMIEPREQLLARDELRRICQYACVRKETAWMGSVLILRFFHGYFPSEIAQILRNSRPSVDVMLRGARREAKLYLEKPAQLSFLKETPAARPERLATQAFPAVRHFAPAADDFLSELRGMIFHSRRGDCLSREQLQELYLASSAEQLKCADLAHIVSCERCLEEVNKLLGLSPLVDRYPTASRDNDSRPGKGGGDDTGAGGGSGSAKEALLRKGRRRVREVFEHKPQELHITVNGLPHGSQRINSRLSEQTLDINLQTPISFIEVFSEQQLRLLFVNAESPPEGPLQQPARVELSEGRTLELLLKFSSPWPTLHTAYYDPTYLEDEEAELGGAVVSAPPAFAPAEPDAPGSDSLLQRCSRLAAGIQYPWQLWRLSGLPLWSRPGAVAAVCTVLLVAALLIARMQLFTPTVTAAELLRKSIATEGATASDVVLHRTIGLEERTSAGELIARRSVEVWQSSGKGVTARRLYDERGALVAGEWSRADGSSTLYRPGSKPRNLQASENQVSAPRGLDDAWQLELSAKDFVALIGQADGARVEELPTAYTISFLGDAARVGLVSARLILARDDLRAIEQTLLVKLGAGETREYRFVETGFEKQPSATVKPAVFDPNPELLGAANVTLESGDRKPPSTPAAPVTGATINPVPAPVKAIATVQLEVEVLSALSRIGADLGEEVSVRRSPGAALQIESVVGTDQRKQEILLALKPFADDPAVEVRVETAAEAAQRNQRNQPARPRESTVIVREAESSGDAIPVHREVRRYLSSKGTPDEQLDVAVNRFASQTLRRSHRATLRVWALRTLVRRFSLSDLQALEAEARAKWLAMIGEHAQEFQRETELLRNELTPIFAAAQAAGAIEAAADISDDAGLLRAVGRLIELGSANDEAIRFSFNISSGGASDGASSAIRTPQFWRSLQLAEQLAAAIGRAAQHIKN